MDKFIYKYIKSLKKIIFELLILKLIKAFKNIKETINLVLIQDKLLKLNINNVRPNNNNLHLIRNEQ